MFSGFKSVHSLKITGTVGKSSIPFRNVLSFCFFIVRFLKFLYKNKIIICLLVVIGLVLGYYLDSKVKKEFKTEVVVVPNFESVDLLYTEVENFKTNLKTNSQKNTYLKEILNLEIKPIENINNVLQERENLEIFKVLSSKLYCIALGRYCLISISLRFFGVSRTTIISLV